MMFSVNTTILQKWPVNTFTNTVVIFDKDVHNKIEVLVKKIHDKKEIAGKELEIAREFAFGQPMDKEGVKRENYLMHSLFVSYIMQGKSAGESTIRYYNDLRASLTDNRSYNQQKVQSFLGGKFLRMYLENKVDQGAVMAASKEIKNSPEFAKLNEELKSRLQTKLASQKTSQADIKRVTEDFLRKKLRRGFGFKTELNTVIGGATGLEVNTVHINLSSTEGEVKMEYNIFIKISDTYDFNNRRSGEYEKFRQKLVLLLKLKNSRNLRKPI
jgi:hypothetical protein